MPSVLLRLLDLGQPAVVKVNVSQSALPVGDILQARAHTAGVMNLVQMSRSLSAFLFISGRISREPYQKGGAGQRTFPAIYTAPRMPGARHAEPPFSDQGGPIELRR